jgi:hypothetical protein
MLWANFVAVRISRFQERDFGRNWIPQISQSICLGRKGGEMTIFAALQALFQAATEYFRLKNQTVYFDLLEKFDSRLDKLEEQRQLLRGKADSVNQSKADDIMSEIVEEKKKLAETKKFFNKP